MKVYKKAVFSKLLMLVFTIFYANSIYAQLVHPGASHSKSDLDRMKYMVQAGIDPWLTTYNNMKSVNYSSYSYSVGGDSSNTTLTSLPTFENDGNAAYHNALMWYITGDERHAKKSVEIFNAWKNITRIENQFALSNGGALWRMVEAAELIKSTYDGWADEDMEKFKAMLVYPGWSGTVAPTAAMSSKNVSFYWNIYQGDRARHGNQGLFGYRSLMAMGVFLDNEIMYQRAFRYLKGYPHLIEDLPYPSGPAVTQLATTGNEYYEEYKLTGWADTSVDYGFNEVMSNYIYENGQCQESSRDQGHSVGGLSIITSMCEIAWNQGDNLYGHLNNRPLLGLEFYFHYNLTWDNSYPDQLTPWEPTVESGEYIERFDRSGRWKSLKINPYVASNIEPENFERGNFNLVPVYEINLAHYKDRLLLDESEFKWLQRGFDYLTEEIGLEDGNGPGSHSGWGGLKYRRVSPGDPISGFDSDGLPLFDMNVLPMTIEAENYDNFVLNGQGKTYNDITSSNTSGEYRTDENVDIEVCSAGGYNINKIEPSEYLTYTVHVPASGQYNIGVNYSGINGNGTLSVSFDGLDKTGAVTLPSTGGEQSWADFTIASDVNLTKGVKRMKIVAGGTSNSFNLNSINITLAEQFSQTMTFEALPVRELGDDDVPLTATVSSGLSISFSSSDTGVASIVNGALQINGVGTTTITATQVGNELFNAVSETQVFQVNTAGSALIIQAEDFSSKSGLSTETTTDVGGGRNVGNTNAGNYLLYTINVPTTGVYVVDYRIASNSDGGELSLQVGGVTVDNLSFAATGGWQTWKTVSSFTEINLTAGVNTIRLNVDAPGWNINWFKLSLKDDLLSIDSVLGLSRNIKVYPNPVSDVLHISNGESSSMEIYNILDELLLKRVVLTNDESVNISNLKTGIYFVRLTMNNVITIKKIIKE